MKTTKLLYLIPAALGLSLAGALAQSVASPPIGFDKKPTIANADNYRSIPFTQKPAFAGLVDSVDGADVTLAGASFAGTDLVDAPHYIHFTDGSRVGEYFNITAHTADTLTVDLNGDNLTGVAAGDPVKVIPHWTLAKLFPSGEQITSSTSPVDLGTQILLPDMMGDGINLPANQTFFYLGALDKWFKVGSGSTDFSAQVVLPDSFMIIREAGESHDGCFSGRVPTDPITINLSAADSTEQDNAVAIYRPIDVTLADSGLISSGAFVASTSPVDIKDQLLVFEDGAGVNRPPAATYFYIAGALNSWFKVGSGSTSFNDALVFLSGNSVLIRKAPVAGGFTSKWTNSPTY